MFVDIFRYEIDTVADNNLIAKAIVPFILP